MQRQGVDITHSLTYRKNDPDYEDQLRADLQWLPVVNFPSARIELGLASDGRWVVAAPHSVCAFSPDKPCVFLLPVLELDSGEARRALEQALLARRLSAEFVDLFPLEDVVATGLESHSEHWTALALKWAQQQPVSPRLQSALQTLKNNGPTQKIRHAAQKLLLGNAGRIGKMLRNEFHQKNCNATFTSAARVACTPEVQRAGRKLEESSD